MADSESLPASDGGQDAVTGKQAEGTAETGGNGVNQDGAAGDSGVPEIGAEIGAGDGAGDQDRDQD